MKIELNSKNGLYCTKYLNNDLTNPEEYDIINSKGEIDYA